MMGNESKKILDVSDPIKCTIIQRINRFVVEVEMEGGFYRASINNSGRLEQFIVSGNKAFCIRHRKPGKTDYRLFAIANGQQAAIIDTRLQMQAFEKALDMHLIPWLDGFQMVRRDAKLGDSRIDYLLKRDREKVYLEAKSAVLRDGEYAMYPDCPTARGRKHISELTEYAHSGGQAIVLFIAALPEVNAFKPYHDGDEILCRLLVTAQEAGVKVKSIVMTYVPVESAVVLDNSDLPIELGRCI